MTAPRLATHAATATSSGTTTVERSTTLPLRQTTGTLVLRAEPAEERHVQWREDVVNNEGMGRKSSKVCCIYHRPHAVDESSGDDSDSSNSSSSEDESDVDDGSARPVGGSRNSKRKSRRHHHDHDHDHGGDGDKENGGGGTGKGKGKARKKSPNAYEKQPKYDGKKTGGGA